MSTLLIKAAPIDRDGFVTQAHIASHHLGNGEITLCGYWIDYTTWKGNASGVPVCSICEGLDA